MFKQGILGCLILLFCATACQNRNTETLSIQGKWRLDSVAVKETQDTFGQALLALALAKSDIDYYEFTPEGQFKVFDSEDSLLSTSRYEVLGNNQQLLLKLDREGKLVKDTFGRILQQSDEALSIKQKEGCYFLKRKE